MKLFFDRSSTLSSFRADDFSTSALAAHQQHRASRFPFFTLNRLALIAGVVWLSLAGVANGQTLLDSFADGNFTASPVWGGDTSKFTVVADSDAAAGATGSQTVRLGTTAVSATDYLSTQIGGWGESQEWGLFIGVRAQALSAANQRYVWLYANESTLNNATVDGYRLAIGDDVSNDEIRLEYVVNGAVSATVITSSGAIVNGLTDIGFLVRVTRSSTGVWTLYTSTLPTANGSGAIATGIPSSANAAVSQGSATHNTIVPGANGYLGVAVLHSTGASAIIGTEFDQVYFTANPPAPVVNTAFGITSSGFTASWSAASGATGYQLDVSTASGFGSFVSVYTNLDVGNVTTTNVTGLSASTTYFYRVRGYNIAGASTNSLTNSVTTSGGGGTAPSISVQPSNQTNNYNTTATFTVTASGTAPLSYQWLTNGVALTDSIKFAGTLTNSLSVSNVLYVNTITNLSVVITNAFGAITSSIVTLTVVDPFIVTQPVNVTNLLGGVASFTVTASGSGSLNYQWRTNGVSVVDGGRFSGATTATLANSGIIAGDTNWSYTVVVGGTGLSVTSSPAVLVMTNAPVIAQYRSKTSGSWNAFATWQVDTGGGFVDAISGQTPTSADGTVTILHAVTNTASVTVDQVVVASGGTLVMNIAFTVSDGSGDDIEVQSGGVFVLSTTSTPPSFNSGATAKIQNGGILRVTAGGLTASGAGVNANSFVYTNGSILDFAASANVPSASGVTYFPNVDTNTIPVFRISAISGSPGGANATVVNGVFEATTTVLWSGTGAKTFRNGIRGTGNVSQTNGAVQSGQFIISGATAELGGTGILSLGTNGLLINSGSFVTLSSDKTINSGAVTNAGTIDLSSRALIMDGLSGGGLVTNTGTANVLTVGTGGGEGSFSGIIGGGLALTKTGAGRLSLSGVNTYTGNTTNLQGTISVNATATFGNGSGTLVLAGGDVLDVNTRAGAPIANPILMTANTTIYGNGTLSDGSFRYFPFSNNFITTVGGTLTVRNAGASGINEFRLRFTGGGFNFSQPIIVGSSSDVSSLTTALHIYNDTNVPAQTFSGNISGTGSIVKSAPIAGSGGITILSGSNSYAGGTVVSEGLLLVNNTAGSGTGTNTVSVTSGGTLGGTGSILGSVTNASGSTLYPGLGGFDTSTLTISNKLGLAGNALFTLNRTNAQNAAKISGLTTVRYGGTLTLTNVGDALQVGDTFTLFSAASYSGGFTTLALPPLTGALVWNTNSLAVNGSVSVQKSATALALVSSSNPSGYLDALTFTASVTPTNVTGSVIFLNGATPFSTNALVIGSAVSSSLATLARGTNSITAIYDGDGDHFGSTNSLNQIVTNHPPSLANDAFMRTAGVNTLRITITDLFTNDTDVDGDALTLASIGLTTTNGITLFTNATYILYTNPANVADQFTYTMTDGFGGTSTATVTINPVAGSAVGQIQNINVSGGVATMQFFGIPGYSYSVERSTNLMDWAEIFTTNAPAGPIDFADDLNPDPPAQAYYRLRYNP